MEELLEEGLLPRREMTFPVSPGITGQLTTRGIKTVLRRTFEMHHYLIHPIGMDDLRMGDFRSVAKSDIGIHHDSLLSNAPSVYVRLNCDPAHTPDFHIGRLSDDNWTLYGIMSETSVCD